MTFLTLMVFMALILFFIMRFGMPCIQISKILSPIRFPIPIRHSNPNFIRIRVHHIPQMRWIIHPSIHNIRNTRISHPNILRNRSSSIISSNPTSKCSSIYRMSHSILCLFFRIMLRNII
eukprot:NODE_479_length_6970_cov_0.750982.p7 type:complete len:120 gc:universal NODE_479_length_6970_cov_0.750982:239-598(+)